jgi:hypothetical protein
MLVIDHKVAKLKLLSLFTTCLLPSGGNVNEHSLGWQAKHEASTITYQAEGAPTN